MRQILTSSMGKRPVGYFISRGQLYTYNNLPELMARLLAVVDP